MRKVIAAINMSVDGFCDHTIGNPGPDVHNHYAELLRGAGTLLYGRTTYLMMEEYWPTLLKNPSADQSMNDFAKAIDGTPKIIFSTSLKKTNWATATLATQSLEEEVLKLRKQPGKDIFVGSPGLIAALTKLHLIDEYQLCIHSVIAGSGLPLFRDLREKVNLRLTKIKRFEVSDCVIHYYEVLKN